MVADQSIATATVAHKNAFDEHDVLRRILEGTATETGQNFFAALVKNLAAALNTHGAWVTEYIESRRVLRSLSFWMGGKHVQQYDEPIDGTPCGRVVEGFDIVHYPDNLMALFPEDEPLKVMGIESYLGAPLLDADKRVMGHLAVMDIKPMPEAPELFAVFRIFAARASAELQRIRAEESVREHETKLKRTLTGAMDAIIELDSSLCVTVVNPSAEKIFGATAAEMTGKLFDAYLSEGDHPRLMGLIGQLGAEPDGKQRIWIKGGLKARHAGGESFLAEATLSRTDSGGNVYYTLVLRNVNDRIEAERKIESLTGQTEYLRQEMRELQNHGAILGKSAPMKQLMDDIAQVAATDATVLILGETGTGKELIARAIHSGSKRKDGPLIRVNCAAIPAMLMESEFFGHEKGAFTGATAKREGRFALAHEGTLFLDEIGELTPDLQAKLLRVLQDGEFEPVGSSKTRTVNVRVVAATNRDLEDAVRDGKFREDLYYRLNVFPIQVPPLRERGDDIVLLAEAFAKRFASRMGKQIAPLSPSCAARLKAYAWPGNVRELQNIIERAVITAQGDCLNLNRALPEVADDVPDSMAPSGQGNGRILTADDLRNLERSNIVRALDVANWKVSGKDGAATALGLSPSTLASRMKALGIARSS
ncbi:MAG: sigma 54-interacting transcriptional regulator [Candidatus Hydrogenedentes bacterium]|nr:sigma 54-interacting transcriptional regulator [Candidatus Hydrogenedentota bacterium]